MDGVNSRVVLILDDMAADHAMRYADIISEIAYNGRHLQIDVIYATQDIVKATTVSKKWKTKKRKIWNFIGCFFYSL